MILLSLLAIVPAAAADNNDKQVTITSLKTDPDTLIVGKEFTAKVHVVTIDTKDKDKMEDMDQAVVLMSLSNGENQQQISLKSADSGDYEAKIKLPKTGTWNVSVIAMNQNQQKSENDMYTMETTLQVKQPQDSSSVWWLIGIVVVVVLLVIYWLYRRNKKKKLTKS